MFSSKYFSQAKVPGKYGSQETKSYETRCSACEKHNRPNQFHTPYVEARPKGGAQAEKEIDEKAQKTIS